MHEDLENNNFIGVHGGANSGWHGLAEIRAGVDMEERHKVRNKAEKFIPSLEKLINHPRTQRRWDDVCSVDPMGMFARHPTMACTNANMTIPEINDALTRDGDIVNLHDGKQAGERIAIAERFRFFISLWS